MKRKTNAALCALLALVCVLCSLVSCGAEEKPEEIPALSDEEARQILTGLMPSSMELMHVFFGEGLKPVEGEEKRDGGGMQYVPVEEGQKFSSIEEMKAAAEAVYSPSYCRELFLLMFTGYEAPRETTGEDIITDYIDPRYREEEGVLQIDLQYEAFEIVTEPVPEKAVVVSGNDIRVTAELPYRVGGVEKGKMRVSLALSGGKWLLDGPTY